MDHEIDHEIENVRQITIDIERYMLVPDCPTPLWVIEYLIKTND